MHMSHSLSAPAERAGILRATRTTRTIFAAILVSVAALWVATPALAHDELVGTQFEVSEEDGQVEAVVLSYSAVILDVGTEIIVTGPDGEDAADGAPEQDGRDVRQALRADLPEGMYDFIWRVVSSDGHPIEGAFSFEISHDDGYVPSVLPHSAEESGSGVEATDEESGHTHDEEQASDSQNDEAPEPVSAADDDDGGFPVGATIAIIAAVVIVGAAAVVIAKRRSASRGDAAEPTDAPNAASKN